MEPVNIGHFGTSEAVHMFILLKVNILGLQRVHCCYTYREQRAKWLVSLYSEKYFNVTSYLCTPRYNNGLPMHGLLLMRARCKLLFFVCV